MITQLEHAIVDYIGWYNDERLHESLGESARWRRRPRLPNREARRVRVAIFLLTSSRPDFHASPARRKTRRLLEALSGTRTLDPLLTIQVAQGNRRAKVTSQVPQNQANRAYERCARTPSWRRACPSRCAHGVRTPMVCWGGSNRRSLRLPFAMCFSDAVDKGGRHGECLRLAPCRPGPAGDRRAARPSA